MKVHKTGTPAPQPQPYWVGMRMVCPCGCVFELEAGDQVLVTNERHPGGKRTVAAYCPTTGCGKTVVADLRPL